jgi:hypothetical protein
MRSALFFGFVGVVFSATVAGAGELPPCSMAEIQVWLVADAQRQAQRHPPGIPLSLNCIVTQQSVLAALLDLQRQLGGGRRVPPPETAIDRSNEPCWINYYPIGHLRHGLMVEGVDFGYCTDVIAPTIDFPGSTPRPTRRRTGRPQPSPSRTPEDDERDYWRRKLLESLRDFRSQQLIDRNRRAGDGRQDRSRLNGNNQSILSIQRDGYVAPTPMPIWQPRQPTANLLLLPSGPPKRGTGGCTVHPDAPC